MDVFSNDLDRNYYLKMMREYCEKYSLTILTWCLMSNHIHLIAVPAVEDSLASAVGSAHKGYSAMFNKLHDAKGYLFQGRFFSAPLDDTHFYAAVRYVLRNPVRAGMVSDPMQYRWSSVLFNSGLAGSDPLVISNERLAWIRHWNEYLAVDPTEIDEIRSCTRTGRPCGSDDFTAKAEQVTGRMLVKRKPGRKISPLELKPPR